MTGSSGFAKAAALTLAVTAHGALALALIAPETTQIEGGDGAAEVRLGNAFEDMAVGTLTADRAQTTETPVVQAQTSPDRPERIGAEQASKALPEDAAKPTEAERAEPAETAKRAQDAEPITAADASAPAPSAPEAPDGLLSPEPPEATAADQPPSLAAKSEADPERLESTGSGSPAVTRSLRPKPRSPEFVETHKNAERKPAAKPKPKPEAKTASRPQQAQGNAEQNARAGEAAGQAEATARASGNAGRQQAAGNAEASNYPGLVMQKLSRAGKPRVGTRGTVVVAFTIGDGGGLASVSLARSSGSSRLDQAAVQLVRGAGPFPAPPQGARRSFSIQIKGS
ncbi:energy transducer TonB family protein [Roseovarius sp. D0-M9]|uniref:energy transducer TonB family protein n=1 Tax=Roseovarius sp. D0-M9 TaxID=3127117 RepID=UPI00300FF41E